jgi:serine/threonine protein kinase
VLPCCLQGKLIGQGSFGSVYLGIDLHTGKEVRPAAVVSLHPSASLSNQVSHQLV